MVAAQMEGTRDKIMPEHQAVTVSTGTYIPERKIECKPTRESLSLLLCADHFELNGLHVPRHVEGQGGGAQGARQLAMVTKGRRAGCG